VHGSADWAFQGSRQSSLRPSSVLPVRVHGRVGLEAAPHRTGADRSRSRRRADLNELRDSQHGNPHQLRRNGHEGLCDPCLDLTRPEPWNKGKLIGAEPPLRPKHVWSIRPNSRSRSTVESATLLCSILHCCRGGPPARRAPPQARIPDEFPRSSPVLLEPESSDVMTAPVFRERTMLTMVLTMTAAGITICGAIIAVFEIVTARALRSESPTAEMPHRSRRRAF
jgi:hypothetical protein